MSTAVERRSKSFKVSNVILCRDKSATSSRLWFKLCPIPLLERWLAYFAIRSHLHLQLDRDPWMHRHWHLASLYWYGLVLVTWFCHPCSCMNTVLCGTYCIVLIVQFIECFVLVIINDDFISFDYCSFMSSLFSRWVMCCDMVCTWYVVRTVSSLVLSRCNNVLNFDFGSIPSS